MITRRSFLGGLSIVGAGSVAIYQNPFEIFFKNIISPNDDFMYEVYMHIHNSTRTKSNKQRKEETLSRVTRFKDYIEKYRGDMEYNFCLGFIAQESEGIIDAKSEGAEALGLTQIIESTGKALGMRIDSRIDERLDPQMSIKYGFDYLENLVNEYGKAPGLVAYNWGPRYVEKVLSDRNTKEWNDFERRIPSSSRKFAARIFGDKVMLDNPKKYSLDIKEQPLFSEGTAPYPVGDAEDFKVISRRLGTSADRIRQLNPHVLDDSNIRGEVIRVPIQ